MEVGQKTYRVIFNPNISANNKAFWVDCETLKEAETALNAIANFTLYCHEQSVFPDYSNIGQIVKWVNSEWEEIEGEEYV